jgi:hypothetical protein
VRLVRVDAYEDHVEFSHADPRGIELLQRPMMFPDGHKGLVSELKPAEAFAALIKTFSGGYLFATEPHTETSCQFHEREVLSMSRQPGSS